MSTTPENLETRFKEKHAQLERYSIFIFGIVFLEIMITLSIWIPEPSKTQFFTFKVAIALSAAGIGALIPGLLEINVPFLPPGVVKAGGAVSFFVLIWFTDPAKVAIERIAPPDVANAPEVSTAYLDILDAKSYERAYQYFSTAKQKVISESTFAQLSRNVRESLGKRIKGPTIANVTPTEDFMGKHGSFVGVQFQSRFESQSDVWADFLVLEAEDGDWKIISHTIVPCQVPNCSPIPGF